MAYLDQLNFVRYACNCGSLQPISKIYFCRHCLKIRCVYCVCHEVDSHYCPNCLVNAIPPSEVRLKKNKCSNCFDCPCCFQSLSTRAGHVPVRLLVTDGEESKDVKATPKKVYYLCCSFCRWSSRDAGIPDQPVATGGWREHENPHTTRINALIDYHKILASREKQQRERNKFQPKRAFLPFKTFGLTSAMVRQRLGRPALSQGQTQSASQPPAAEATEKVEELPPEIFTQSVDITKITTLEQRLKQLDMQPEKVNELRPQYRQFLVKRSQRCRVCEHNVSKPDTCLQSTKFKIQLAAFYHVPEVKIVTCEALIMGKTSELLLKFCNPTQHPTHISLLDLSAPLTVSVKSEELKEESPQAGCESPSLLPSIVRQIRVVEEPKEIAISPNADVTLPMSPIILPRRDDAAEYDDTNDTHNYQDDRNLVVWRKGNKAIVRLVVTPHQEAKPGDTIIIGLVMQYMYVNTIATLEHKSPQKVDLREKLYLTIGELIKSS